MLLMMTPESMLSKHSLAKIIMAVTYFRAPVGVPKIKLDRLNQEKLWRIITFFALGPGPYILGVKHLKKPAIIQICASLSTSFITCIRSSNSR